VSITVTLEITNLERDKGCLAHGSEVAVHAQLSLLLSACGEAARHGRRAWHSTAIYLMARFQRATEEALSRAMTGRPPTKPHQ
jgi:hypothetical protein